jgi:hypothetical protein
MENAWEYCHLFLFRDAGRTVCQLAYCLPEHSIPLTLDKQRDDASGLELFRETLAALGQSGWEAVSFESSYQVNLEGTIRFPSSVALSGSHDASAVVTSAWLKRRVVAGRAIDDWGARTGPSA